MLDKVLTRDDLTTEQVEVVDRLVYAWSDSPTGAWPIFQWLEHDVEVNCGFDLEPVLASLNPDLVQYDRYVPGRPDSIVALAVPGLACAVNPPATPYLNLFLKALRWALRRYDEGMEAVARDRPVSIEISADMARADWTNSGGEATPLVLARAGELLGREPGVWEQRGGPLANGADWTMVLSRDIRQYRGVKTLADYLVIRAERYGRWAGRSASAAQTSSSAGASTADDSAHRDLFLSHASEDKEPFVNSLHQALVARGLKVWYDKFELHVGDSLRESIDGGLAHSDYGVVVLSHAFFAKSWPKAELDALFAKMIAGRGRILPVLHGISVHELGAFSPTLADRLAAESAGGADRVADQIAESIGRDRRVGNPA